MPTMQDLNETPAQPTGALSDEGAANLIGFLECIRDIVDDLLAQGFTIVDGKLVPPPPDHR